MTRLGKDARLVQDERGIYSIEPTEAAFLQQVIGLAGTLGWKWFHDYATNQPPMTSCDKTGTCTPLPAHGTNFVPLHTAPDAASPLITDPVVHPDGSPGTTSSCWPAFRTGR